MNIPESDRPILLAINANIELQSLLWDLDLLPEQLRPGTLEWTGMKMLVVGFILGKHCGTVEVLQEWQVESPV